MLGHADMFCAKGIARGTDLRKLAQIPILVNSTTELDMHDEQLRCAEWCHGPNNHSVTVSCMAAPD